MSWHEFQMNYSYQKDEVVEMCLEHIGSGKVDNPTEKRRYVNAINNSIYSTIVFMPFSSRGWGCSPMNPDCWKTESGESIWEAEILSSKSTRNR